MGVYSMTQDALSYVASWLTSTAPDRDNHVPGSRQLTEDDREFLALLHEWITAIRYARHFMWCELSDEKQAWDRVNELHRAIVETPAVGVVGIAIKPISRSMIGMAVGARIVPRFPVTASTGKASSRTPSVSCRNLLRWPRTPSKSLMRMTPRRRLWSPT
jgi:hypothetical protein